MYQELDKTVAAKNNKISYVMGSDPCPKIHAVLVVYVFHRSQKMKMIVKIVCL